MTDVNLKSEHNVPHAELSTVDSTAKQIRNSVGLASEDEMAAILQISHETLATWRTKKRGPPSIKLGKKVFYLVPDFSRWVMEEVQRQHAPAPPRHQKVKQFAAHSGEWTVP